MISYLFRRRYLCMVFSALAILHWVGLVQAQVTAVVVGVTPNCPYGFPGCWPGAKEALAGLDDVLSVSSVPDSYNCTAHVHLKHRGLPDVVKWPKQFKKMVGGAYVFRGVEVTIKASVEEKDGCLVLQAPGLDQPVTLAPLRTRLQWNFKKNAPRQPEPDERRAYRKLAAKKKKAQGDDLKVEITGPLRRTDRGLVLEVREFFLIYSDANVRRQD